MPRPGVTKAQVFEAADQLTQAGHNPTVLAIRKHLGTGSPNTIGPHLADWKAQAEGPTDTAEMGPTPEPVEAAMRKVWSLALSQAQEQLQGELAELRQEATEARERAANLEGQVSALKEQFEALTVASPDREPATTTKSTRKPTPPATATRQ